MLFTRSSVVAELSMVSVSELEFPVSSLYCHVLLLLYYQFALCPDPPAYAPLALHSQVTLVRLL